MRCDPYGSPQYGRCFRKRENGLLTTDNQLRIASMKFIPIVFSLAISACMSGGSDTGDAGSAQGELGGSCYPNMTCNETLACINDICATDTSMDAGHRDAGDIDAGETCAIETTTQHVFDTLVSPASAGQAAMFAQDINDDGIADNAFGGLLGALEAQAGFSVAAALQKSLLRGEFIQLLSVGQDSLATCAIISVSEGSNPMPTPCAGLPLASCGQHLNGTAAFVSSLMSEVVDGSISADLFATNADSEADAFVFLSFENSSPFAIPLHHTKISADIGPSRITNGLIGGGISMEDVNALLLPKLHGAIQATVEADCGSNCGCMSGETGSNLLNFFDTDGNCVLSLAEFQNNSLITATLLNPDLDLVGDDGVDDHLSIGLQFTAIQAVY